MRPEPPAPLQGLWHKLSKAEEEEAKAALAKLKSHCDTLNKGPEAKENIPKLECALLKLALMGKKESERKENGGELL